MNSLLLSALSPEAASLFSGLRTETGSLLLLGLALFGLASLTRRLITPAVLPARVGPAGSGKPGVPLAA
jgi:hypothetical protein